MQFAKPLEDLYPIEAIEHGFRNEHPDWSEADVLARSLQIFDAQLDDVRAGYNSERRFQKHNSLIGLDPDHRENAEYD